MVRFTFALTDECPQPLPVGAQLHLSRPDGSRPDRAELLILNDLGGLEFDQC